MSQPKEKNTAVILSEICTELGCTWAIDEKTKKIKIEKKSK